MEKNKMKKLLEMLKRHEGEVVTNGRHVAYKCPSGYWTVGVGRNIDPNGGIGLSDEEIDFLLEGDIARVIKELSSAKNKATRRNIPQKLMHVPVVVALVKSAGTLR